MVKIYDGTVFDFDDSDVDCYSDKDAKMLPGRYEIQH